MNFIPNTKNTSPDYYCTWQSQLYVTSDGGPAAQRKHITEEDLFGNGAVRGFADMYPDIRGDLFLVMDDSWDVHKEEVRADFGMLIPAADKFPFLEGLSPKDALKALVDRIQALGWKGLGGWIFCGPDLKCHPDMDDTAFYTERMKWMRDAGFSYWKVDWGSRTRDVALRQTMTELAHKIAPHLTVEHAVEHDLIPTSDVFRTYDVPAVLSIPMTMQKMKDCLIYNTKDGYRGLVCCEDEVYIAASLGATMGVMRHNLGTLLPDGRPDPSFPDLHRRLKTKMTEVKRAVRFHRLAGAYGADGSHTTVSDTVLTDTFHLTDQPAEMEAWWKFVNGDIVEKSGPAAIARNIGIPEVHADACGRIPYVTAMRHPNGIVAVCTSGRTEEKDYITPDAEVILCVNDASDIGVFGHYGCLVLRVDTLPKRVFAQDLAAEEAVDITKMITMADGRICISGALIDELGTAQNPMGDTSEAGLLLHLER